MKNLTTIQSLETAAQSVAAARLDIMRAASLLKDSSLQAMATRPEAIETESMLSDWLAMTRLSRVLEDIDQKLMDARRQAIEVAGRIPTDLPAIGSATVKPPPGSPAGSLVAMATTEPVAKRRGRKPSTAVVGQTALPAVESVASELVPAPELVAAASKKRGRKPKNTPLDASQVKPVAQLESDSSKPVVPKRSKAAQQLGKQRKRMPSASPATVAAQAEPAKTPTKRRVVVKPLTTDPGSSALALSPSDSSVSVDEQEKGAKLAAGVRERRKTLRLTPTEKNEEVRPKKPTDVFPKDLLDQVPQG